MNTQSGYSVKRIICLAMLAGLCVAWAWLANTGQLKAMDEAGMYLFRTAGNTADAIGPDWVTSVMTVITHIGGSAVLIVASLLVLGALWRIRGWAVALRFAGPIVGAFILVPTFKLFFARARPELVEHLVHVSTQSFPSGHALRSAVVYTVVALALTTMRPTAGRAIKAGLAALIAAVGISRVFLGVHWPSDIVGAWLFATLWLVFCYPLIANMPEKP